MENKNTELNEKLEKIKEIAKSASKKQDLSETVKEVNNTYGQKK